jgi:hypothetical protein
MNNPRRIQRHLVKALAAGAVLVAAALPLAIAGSAGAAPADAITSIVFAQSGTNEFGTGATGTAVLNGTFAGDGGNATLTTNAPGVTFTNVVDNSTTQLTDISYASTTATVPGTYNLTFTDDNGTVIDNTAFTVAVAPVATSISPNTVADTAVTSTLTGAVITGANFVTIPATTGVGATPAVYPTVVLTNTTNNTTVDATVTASTTSTLTVDITPTNSTNGAPATPGSYTITVTNPDGGTTTSAALFTVTGDEVSAVSPSAIALDTGTTITQTLTVLGGGFQSGATVSLQAPGAASTTACTDAAASATNVVSSTELTFTVTSTVAAGAQCDVTVTNTGNNGASYQAVDALGFGEASAIAPVITASSLTTGTAIEAGSAPQNITFTGAGFSNFTLPGITTYGSPASTDASAALEAGQCIGGSVGTSITCELDVSSGAHAGAHTASLTNDGAAGTLANAFTVAGAAITSAAPSAIAIGAPVGTTVVLTGTGFSNTSTGTVSGGGTGLGGFLTYVSPTTENFVVTTSPTTAGSATISLSTTDSDGAVEVSTPFTLPVDGAPSVTSITYATGTTGVGLGATAQTITINGTGFSTGATVGTFVNAAGTADPDVTAKVTSVNTAGTQITATVAVVTGDTNAVDGYSVTNTDGGTAKAAAVAPAGLVLDAAPTITAVSPVTATPAATNAFTITGTGFQTGATVVLSSDGTCGAATVASATSITASCTVGEPGTAAVTLSVVNPDGGTATSGTILAAKAAGTTSTFHVTNPAHGTAIAGKTSTLTISGTGFYGQPKITSNAAGTKVGVSKDSGKVLTIRVTTKATTGAGEHTFTIRLANGKTGKANYAVKK